MASLISNGGLYYGIDFKGGTVVDVRFAGPPPIDTIRNGLAQQGIGNSTIVPVSDIATAEFERSSDQPGRKGRRRRSPGRRQDGHSERPARHLGRGRARQAGFQRRWRRKLLPMRLTRKDPLGARRRRPGDRYAQLAQADCRFPRQGSRRHRHQPERSFRRGRQPRGDRRAAAIRFTPATSPSLTWKSSARKSARNFAARPSS